MTRPPEMREAIARTCCYWADPVKNGTCHDNYCGSACRAVMPEKQFFDMADAVLALTAPLEGGGEGKLGTAMRLLAELAPITGLSSRFEDDELLPDHLRRRPTVATVREAHALLRAHRTAVSTSPPQATKPLKMLVDTDWLRRHVESDPDLDCEATSPPQATNSEVERLREAIKRARGLLLYPLREHLDDRCNLNTTGTLAVADVLLAVEGDLIKPVQAQQDPIP